MAEIAVFILGLIFGSFANVIVLRLNTGESLIFGGSRCFFCGRELKWFELIPVLSFFAWGGKCRTCGCRISWQYPALEAASGILFLLVYIFGRGPGIYIPFFWLLLAASAYDIRHKIIPNQLVYSAAAVILLYLTVGSGVLSGDWGLLVRNLAVGAGLSAFFAFLWLVSKGRWMGFGDAKMAFVLGLALGWPAGLVGLFVSFWLGAAAGLIYLLFSSSASLKAEIPFAPFLFAGGLSAFLWGDFLISWYLSLI
ncbi:MAG: prepilin peptidase [Candidatus Niyogibacteria bacterium]|nr:prepilin peptidase [Candidatus Niyogibacteria bacterium]